MTHPVSPAETESTFRPSGQALDLAARFRAELPSLVGQSTSRTNVSQQRFYRWLVFGMFAVYAGGGIALYLWRGQSFKVDTWALFLLVAAVLLGRIGPFLRDWIPFVFLVFGYEFLRGVAGEIVTGGERVGTRARDELPNVHLESLIRFDLALFGGHEPVSTIQGWLYTANDPQWWDFMAIVIYAFHFALPLLFAFLLWITGKDRFWQFTLALCLMCYSAFLAFLLFPAAPPWLANTWGVVSGIGWPAGSVTARITYAPIRQFDTLTIWQDVSPHPVAAMPSLHAAFPWLVLLFAVKFFGWKGLVVVPYNMALWFTVVYLANHWVVDILAGMAWATVSFVVIDWLWNRLASAGTSWVPQPLLATIGAITDRASQWLGPIWHAPSRLRQRLRNRLASPGK